MAFHNRVTDGPMKQKLIVTKTEDMGIESASVQHYTEVSKFNEEHNVFFTQDTFYAQGALITSCLYADGNFKPKVKPPMPPPRSQVAPSS